MSKKSNRKRIAELSTRVKQLESSFTKLVIAREGISTRPSIVKAPAKAKSPIASAKRVSMNPAPEKSAPARKTPSRTAARTSAKRTDARRTPTLVDALRYVLQQHRDAKAGPVKAIQLYDEVHQAGYRFAGTNRKNNMNYTYKLLRTNKAFKKAGADGYTLAQ